ncbi:hypothetical protein [Micromonospora aurantiaca (nom. illeg.)]
MREREWPMHHKNQVPVMKDIWARVDELTEQLREINEKLEQRIGQNGERG